MAENPFNEPLQTIRTTISSIKDKVDQQKAKANGIKAGIIGKLQEIQKQIAQITNTSQAIAQLKKDLNDARQQIVAKDGEIAQLKSDIEGLRRQVQELTDEKTQIQAQIQQLQDEIERLKRDGQAKDNLIREKTEQLNALQEQKTQVDNQLATLNRQVAELVNKLTEINTLLSNQINLIDTIFSDYEQGEKIDDQLSAVAANLQLIIDQVNPVGGQSEIQQSEQQFTPEIEQLYNDFINSEQGIKNMFYTSLRMKGKPYTDYQHIIQDGLYKIKDPNTKSAGISAIKGALQAIKTEGGVSMSFTIPGSRGGKRRRKTMKKRNKRTRKMRGGYTYVSSNKLDNSSSVVSVSGSKSSSGSKPKSKKYKYRYSRRN
jgi:DNA repair exonuclease SbcCD ATPase subunit